METHVNFGQSALGTVLNYVGSLRLSLYLKARDPKLRVTSIQWQYKWTQPHYTEKRNQAY